MARSTRPPCACGGPSPGEPVLPDSGRADARPPLSAAYRSARRRASPRGHVHDAGGGRRLRRGPDAGDPRRDRAGDCRDGSRAPAFAPASLLDVGAGTGAAPGRPPRSGRPSSLTFLDREPAMIALGRTAGSRRVGAWLDGYMANGRAAAADLPTPTSCRRPTSSASSTPPIRAARHAVVGRHGRPPGPRRARGVGRVRADPGGAGAPDRRRRPGRRAVSGRRPVPDRGRDVVPFPRPARPEPAAARREAGRPLVGGRALQLRRGPARIRPIRPSDPAARVVLGRSAPSSRMVELRICVDGQIETRTSVAATVRPGGRLAISTGVIRSRRRSSGQAAGARPHPRSMPTGPDRGPSGRSGTLTLIG